MSENAAPLEILWTAITMIGLLASICCFHYARIDRLRLRRSAQNGTLDRIASEALERELSRFMILLFLSLIGILVMVQPPRPGGLTTTIGTIVSWLNMGIVGTMAFNAVRTLLFRRWLLRRPLP